MSLRSFARRLWHALARTTQARRPAPHRRTRLAFDLLEDRVVPATLLVTSLADTGPGSLRNAIAQANVDAGNGSSDTIDFAASLNGQAITVLSELTVGGTPPGGASLNRNSAGISTLPTITIDGAGQIVLDGNNQMNLFQVDSGVAAVLTGLTISGGAPGASSAAIFNQGTLAVNACTITDNVGAGVANTGTLTITASTVADNGGSGIVNAAGTMTVYGCTISGNLGSLPGDTTIPNPASTGGGILNDATLTVSDSTIADNTVTDRGGGIFNAPGGALTVSDSTITGNTAVNSGGGIDNAANTAVLLTSTIVAGNTISNSSATSGWDIYGPASGGYDLTGPGVTGLGSHGNKQSSNAQLNPLDSFGGPTQTESLQPASPAIGGGGRLTALASTATGTTLLVQNAATIAATPGTYVLSIDGEQILTQYNSGNQFTILARAYNGSKEALHLRAGDPVFLALDQAGRPRVQYGSTDIGATEHYSLVLAGDPADQTAATGQAVTFTASAAATAPIGNISWWVSTDGGDTFSQIPGNGAVSADGIATATLVIPHAIAAENGNLYEAEFTGSGAVVVTDPALLTVGNLPAITLNPQASLTATVGASVTLTAAATGATAVQWLVSTDNGNTWGPISGASAATYAFTAAGGDNGNLYEAVFTNGIGSSTTNPTTLTISGTPTVTAIPGNQTVDNGTSVTWTASASDPAAMVQWYFSRDGKMFNAITGATSTTYTFTAVPASAGQYQVVFTNAAGSVTSSAWTLNVNYLVNNTAAQQGPTQVDAGTQLNFSASAAGYPVPSITWQLSTNGGPFSTLSQYDNQWGIGYTPHSGTKSFQLEATISNNTAAQPAQTIVANDTVNYAPVVTQDPPQSLAVVANDLIALTAAADGSPTPTVQWQSLSPNPLPPRPGTLPGFADIPGATNPTLVISNPQPGWQYRAVFTNSWAEAGAGSASSHSATTTVTTLKADSVTTNPKSVTVDETQNAVFTVASANTADAVQWYVVPPGKSTGQALTNGPLYSGVTTTTLTISNVNLTLNGMQYYAVFTNNLMPLKPSSKATLTINRRLAAATVNTTAVVNTNFQSAIGIIGGTTPFTIPTFTGLPPGLTPFLQPQPGSTTPYEIIIKGKPTQVGNYTGTITLKDAAGASVSVNVTIDITPPPVGAPL